MVRAPRIGRAAGRLQHPPDRHRPGVRRDHRGRRRQPPDRLRDRDRGAQRGPHLTRGGRGGAAAARARHPHLLPRHGERAVHRAGRAPECPGARRRAEEDDVRELRGRGRRERGEDRPQGDRAPGDRDVRPRVPRPDAARDVAHRQGHAVQAGHGAVRARDLPAPVRLPVQVAGRSRAMRRGGARLRARRDPQAHRRGERRGRDPRADPGRGRLHRPGAGLRQGPGRVLLGARDPLHRRRDPERHGPRRPLVRDRGRGRRPRPDHQREVARRRPADQRRHRSRRRHGRGARRRARRHVRRQPGRGRRGARGARSDREGQPARALTHARREGARPVARDAGPPPVDRRRPGARDDDGDRARLRPRDERAAKRSGWERDRQALPRGRRRDPEGGHLRQRDPVAAAAHDRRGSARGRASASSTRRSASVPGNRRPGRSLLPSTV